jgi:NAD(P)H dehydrogenase (quinone)
MGFQPVSDRRNFAEAKDAGYFKQQVEEKHASDGAGFAPDVEAEYGKLAAADLMIWQFPLWWFGMPAILKGWVDKVFAFGRTYGYGHIYETGIFKGRRALVSTTTGGPEAAYRPDGFNGDIEAILRPIQRGMLSFVGFDVLRPEIVWQPAHLEAAARRAALDAWARRIDGIAGEMPVAVGRY